MGLVYCARRRRQTTSWCVQGALTNAELVLHSNCTPFFCMNAEGQRLALHNLVNFLCFPEIFVFFVLDQCQEEYCTSCTFFSLFALMEQQGFPLNLGILRIKAR